MTSFLLLHVVLDTTTTVPQTLSVNASQSSAAVMTIVTKTTLSTALAIPLTSAAWQAQRLQILT